MRADQLKTATEWLEGYRRFWEESFDRLDKYLATLKANEASEKKRKPARAK